MPAWPVPAAGQLALESAVEALLEWVQAPPPLYDMSIPQFNMHQLHRACASVLQAVAPNAVAGRRLGSRARFPGWRRDIT